MGCHLPPLPVFLWTCQILTTKHPTVGFFVWLNSNQKQQKTLPFSHRFKHFSETKKLFLSNVSSGLHDQVLSGLRQRHSPFSVVSPGRTNGQCTQIPAPINQDLRVMIGNPGNHVKVAEFQCKVPAAACAGFPRDSGILLCISKI